MAREGCKPRRAAWLVLGLVSGLAGAQTNPSLPATAAVVQRMPQANQQAFAQLALDHLIDRFRSELRRTPGKAAGWQRGTGGYLAQLQALRAEVDAGASVRLLKGAGGSWRLMVGSRQVMLQTPREAVQAAFERSLVDDWCAMTECANPDAPPPATQVAELAPVGAGSAPTAPPEDAGSQSAAGARAATDAGSSAEESASSLTVASVPPSAGPQAVAVPQALAVGPAQATSDPQLAAASPGATATALPDSPIPPPQPVAPTRETVRLPSAPPANAAAAPAPLPRPGTWQFTDDAGPTFASEDGLQCVYGDALHLKLKQASCTALMQDLRRVVAGLRAAATRGEQIDWSALRLEPRGLGKPAHFSVGTGGKGFEADVPHLAAAPGLLAPLTPWLQGRVRGQTPVGQIELPDQLSYLEANLR